MNPIWVVTVLRSEPPAGMTMADVYVLESNSPEQARDTIKAMYNSTYTTTVAGLAMVQAAINRYWERRKREPKIDKG